jgi:hypothetical protein
MIHPLTSVMRSGDDTSLYSRLYHSNFLNKNKNTTRLMAHTLVSQELEIEFSKLKVTNYCLVKLQSRNETEIKNFKFPT